jgi:hypothetical protein
MMVSCLVDTNVAITANGNVPDDLILCAVKCIEIIEKVMKSKSLVLDEDGEIFAEYTNKLSYSGQPGVGDRFLKWVHDNQWKLQRNRVAITKNGDSYDEFPDHEDLKKFDISDRKFIAVAYAHVNNPIIYQATDSKWWGWKEALSECGIKVDFICPDYIEAKYKQKMGS